jgi:hypothetical protein
VGGGDFVSLRVGIATNPMAQYDNFFSLTDIKKKADKIQIFDERTIDEEGKAISFVDQMALVTH